MTRVSLKIRFFKNNNRKSGGGNIYFPTIRNTEFDTLPHTFSLELLLNSLDTFIQDPILGDFNAHHSTWASHIPQTVQVTHFSKESPPPSLTPSTGLHVTLSHHSTGSTILSRYLTISFASFFHAQNWHTHSGP